MILVSILLCPTEWHTRHITHNGELSNCITAAEPCLVSLSSCDLFCLFLAVFFFFFFSCCVSEHTKSNVKQKCNLLFSICGGDLASQYSKYNRNDRCYTPYIRYPWITVVLSHALFRARLPSIQSCCCRCHRYNNEISLVVFIHQPMVRFTHPMLIAMLSSTLFFQTLSGSCSFQRLYKGIGRPGRGQRIFRRIVRSWWRPRDEGDGKRGGTIDPPTQQPLRENGGVLMETGGGGGVLLSPDKSKKRVKPSRRSK